MFFTATALFPVSSKRKIKPVCGAPGALYFLEPMLIEHGLGTLLWWCDRLASDEPEPLLPSPT
jgi:hypothetical protein